VRAFAWLVVVAGFAATAGHSCLAGACSLLSGLRDLGWIEGNTIGIEYRSANWNLDLLDVSRRSCSG
jgi:hypothetical protein